MFLRLFFKSPRSAVSAANRARQLFTLPFVLLVASALSAAQQGAVDLSGRTVNPLQSSSGKVVVLIFIRRDCPISGRYAPTIQRFSSEHHDTVHFYLVFPDKSDSSAEIRKYLDDFRYSIPAVRDPQHVLVKLAHAQFTPEAAVLDRKGALVYHGRIDDLFVSFGHARSAPTTHELQDAIGAALAGRPPSHPEVAGIGCYISDLE
jgi:thiol-disulfide isomerase/thioredoxin